MRFDQERRPEGLFYREQKGYFMENTLWVDDLYMCTPFLIRYAQLSGDTFYLDDAATQFIGFRKLLFLPESNVMSHVFDFKCNTATRMPWGRGNGWCLFSLSELLTVLPTNHKNREELIDFYNSLCAGLIPLQAESGLWRQLLTHTDSYEESSCTAMFVYAFCRGLRMNWIDKALTASVSKAAKLGWDGLCHKSIDDQGNIFGICGGSCYSFSPDYYKHDLGWIVNDPHGTGIVLLAGTEMDKWMKLTSNK
jgi:rhamnogalacturonyl hydrolase YesR